MSNVPFPSNEHDRIKALKAYGILDTLNEKEYDRLTRLASIICDVPISLVSLIDDDRQWFKSRVGLDATETPRDVAFCSHAIMGNELFEIEDAAADQRFEQNPLVTGEPNIRFYAGYPLVDSDGYALGTLCVIDRKPRKLNATQQQALRLLAEEVTDLITRKRKLEDLGNFERLFHISEDIICIADTEQNFKKVNPAFTEILGWTTADLEAKTLFGLVHPADKELVQRELKKLYLGVNSINFNNRFKTKTNEYKILDWVATVERGTGNIFAIARDVTGEKLKEQKLITSENKLRAFFEHSQGLMCTHDMGGKFLTVNDAGAQLIGYTPAELAGKGLFDITPPRIHNEITQYLQDIRINGTASGTMATVHKDGSPRVWMFNNVLETDESGNDYVIGNAVDITDRYQLEKDLVKTKDTLEQINKVANVGGWENNLEKNTVFWSDITRQIYGVARDHVPAPWSSFSFYKEGENRDKLKQAVENAIATGQGWDLELQIVTPQGIEKWVRIIGETRMANSKCVALFGTVQDIDEKKKIYLEVARSRKQLDDILRSATEVSVIATDARGIITVFSKGAENMLGYTAEEMVGRKAPTVLHDPAEMQERIEELHKEYGIRFQDNRLFIYKSEKEGQETREWTYIRKDGSRLTVSLVTTTIRDDDNNVIGYLGIATDITERKKAEAAVAMERSRLKAFVEHAPAAVAMLDTEIRYIAYSSRWLEEYHLGNRDLSGLSHYEVFPNLSDEWKEIHKRGLRGEVITTQEECWRPDGWDHDQYLRWEVRPWYLPDGTVGGIMMFTQDITAQVHQREELKIAKLHAEQASVAKSEFLANMSHEIRTPLNGVIGFTDLVLKTELTETQQQYLSIVNNSANALLSIINDILDFSKIEAGKLELDIDKCDIFELAAEATDIITYQAQKKGLEVLLNISPELPRFVWADAVRVKQIVVNLLGNAVKFTSAGEIELKIEALTDIKRDQITYRVQVRDTGIGIKPEMQNKIFEAFAQEDPSTTKKYGGTGLGLTISNRLLALMGSKLKLKSTVGEGSTFYFDITLKSEPGEAIPAVDADLVKNVLIVDDNQNNRLILKEMLQLRNISSEGAQNGFEALQKLATGGKFDVIFMDYHMPYMDGLETIRKIRDSFSNTARKIPIYLLHSSSDDETIIRASQELEVRHRLVKPIKMQEMYQALTKLYDATGNISVPEAVAEVHAGPKDDRFTVLLAEDNDVNILLAKTIIQRIAPKATIVISVNGEDAVRRYKEHKPDIILMDIQMPLMNGYEATEAIREYEAATPAVGHVPIVALTAGNVKGEREKCIAAGMDDFMAKPFVETSLEVLLNKWVWKDNTPITATELMNTSEHFDAASIKENFSIDDETLIEILKATIAQLEESKESLHEAIKQKDLKKLNSAGHKLFGTAVSTSLGVLGKMASSLEHMSFYDDREIDKLVYNIEREMELIVSLINKVIA